MKRDKRLEAYNESKRLAIGMHDHVVHKSRSKAERAACRHTRQSKRFVTGTFIDRNPRPIY